jgi:hypothetical protein
MPTWVLIVIVSSSLSGKPVLGPAGVTSVTGYISAEACDAAGAAIKQKDAMLRLMQMARRQLDEPERLSVEIDPHCIPGPIVK